LKSPKIVLLFKYEGTPGVFIDETACPLTSGQAVPLFSNGRAAGHAASRQGEK
jgi:hypothetical protein